MGEILGFLLLFFILRLFALIPQKLLGSHKTKQLVNPTPFPEVRKEESKTPGEGEGYSILRKEQMETQVSIEGEGYSILRAEQQVMQPSGEGEDRCDPDLGHHRVIEPENVYAHEIADDGKKLDLSAQGVWQGVVMSEILARPNALRKNGWKRN